MSSRPNFISRPDARLDNESQTGIMKSELATVTTHLFRRVAELGNEEENWTGVTEQTKRRKLQNRLNQRARRQRLQDYGSVTHQSVSTTMAFEEATEVQQAAPLDNGQVTVSAMMLRCQLGRPESRAMLENFAKQAIRSYQLGTPNVIHLADTVRSNVFLAFVRNVQILGFDDGWLTNDAISPFNMHGPLRVGDRTADCPTTMRPTPLQGAVEHHPWIDLFPCPRMRNNFLGAVLIYGEEAVDEDGLCHDIVDAGDGRGEDATAIIAWTNPWSPNGWEVTEKFLKKWAWLLYGCVELQAGTNSWRQRRGLRPLRFPGC